MIDRLLTLFALALVVVSCTATVSRANIFSALRKWLNAHAPLLGKLVSCPYCLSHWVTFIVVGLVRPQTFDVHPAVNYILASFAIVTLTMVLLGVFFQMFENIPPSKEALEAAEAEEQIDVPSP